MKWGESVCVCVSQIRARQDELYICTASRGYSAADECILGLLQNTLFLMGSKCAERYPTV